VALKRDTLQSNFIATPEIVTLRDAETNFINMSSIQSICFLYLNGNAFWGLDLASAPFIWVPMPCTGAFFSKFPFRSEAERPAWSLVAGKLEHLDLVGFLHLFDQLKYMTGEMRAISVRFAKIFSFLIVVFYVLPMSLQAGLALCDRFTTSALANTDVADMASAGLLPAAETEPAARIHVLSVPLSGSPGRFLTHSWIVYKHQGASAWVRYEVLGFASRDSTGSFTGEWLDNQPSLNRFAPDGKWFGRVPEVIASVEGEDAERMIPKIEKAIDDYPETAGHYRTWPGPNSNTFVATVVREVPELETDLPPTAVGKDFRKGVFLGWTDSHTGFELNLNGVLGLKIGRVEGIEVNLFTLVAGVDLSPFSFKLPGVGVLSFATRQPAPDGREAPRVYAGR